MVEEKVVEWQAPPQEYDGYRKKGWCDELIQNGDRWLKGQKSIANINDDIRVLMGGDQADNAVESNTLQTDIRTFVETIADLRQIVTFGSKAEQFKRNVQLYNDVTKYMFWNSDFCQNSRKALQYAMLGRGYLWMKTGRTHYGWGPLKTQFEPLGPLEVIPEQLPADNSISGAYAVTIIRPMALAEAHARFPKFQDRLQPISRYDWKSYGTLASARRLDFYSRWRFGEDDTDWDNRYAEIRLTFCRDLRINKSGAPMQMGAPGTTWGYEVPFCGQLLVTTNPFNNLPESRLATEEDCRVYPNLRLMITTPSVPVPLYDGPAFDWHGEMPVVEYDVNDWPWSPLGYSLIHGVASLERARRRLMSTMDEVTQVNLDPPMGYDLHSGVARTDLQKMDLLRSQGYRVGTNTKPGDALKSMLPEGMKVNSEHFKQLEVLQATQKAALGLNDVASLRELKMNVSSESMDKILENLGPIGTGIATSMWKAHSKIGQMLKFTIPQYYTVADLENMVGPEAVDFETFDNDPTSLIPSHLPGESQDGESKYAKRERAKWFAGKIGIVSLPSEIMNVTQMQEKQMYLLFLQKGIKGISRATIFEKLGVQNYGNVNGDTEYEKWKNESLDDALFELKAKIMLAKEMEAAGIQPQPDKPGQGKGGGRPPTGAKPPHTEMRGTKSGNPRVIQSQSK